MPGAVSNPTTGTAVAYGIARGEHHILGCPLWSRQTPRPPRKGPRRPGGAAGGCGHALPCPACSPSPWPRWPSLCSSSRPPSAVSVTVPHPRPAPPTEWSPPGDPVRSWCAAIRVQGSTGTTPGATGCGAPPNMPESPDFVGPRNDLFDPVADRPGDHRYAADFDTDHAGVWEPPRRKSRNASAGKSSTPTALPAPPRRRQRHRAVPAQPKRSTGPAASLLPPGSPKATSASCSARSPVWVPRTTGRPTRSSTATTLLCRPWLSSHHRELPGRRRPHGRRLRARGRQPGRRPPTRAAN